MLWCLHDGNQTQILITYSQGLLHYSGYIHTYVYSLTHNAHIYLSSQSHGCAKSTPCSLYVLNTCQPKLIEVVCKLRVLLRAYSLEGWLRVQAVNNPHRETISFCCFALDLCIFILFCASEWFPNGKELLHARCESCLVKWALWIPEAAGLECIYESRKVKFGRKPVSWGGWLIRGTQCTYCGALCFCCCVGVEDHL